MRTDQLSWEQYAAMWARLHGGFDPRRAKPAVHGWMRLAYLGGTVLARLRVSPTTVTGVGVLICLAVPVAATRGAPGLLVAAVLVLAAALADAMDGAVALVTRRASRLGYVYDSLADRIGEAAWLAAFWLAGAPGPLVVAGGAACWLHEYLRARATTAGMRGMGRVTVGERPTRVSVAVTGLLLAGAGGLLRPELAAGTMTIAAVAWLFFSGFGLIQLHGAVRRSITGADIR